VDELRTTVHPPEHQGTQHIQDAEPHRLHAPRNALAAPSLCYQFFRRVSKLKPEFQALPPEEIGRRRRGGEFLVDEVDRLGLALCH
jgi:hypothetical protein